MEFKNFCLSRKSMILGVSLLLILPVPSAGIQWLALSKISSATTVGSQPDKMCEAMKGSLIKKQVTFCKRNPAFMESVRVGAARAIDECQYQFRSRRWNCSSTLEDKFRNDLGINPSNYGHEEIPMSSSYMAGNLSPGTGQYSLPGRYGPPTNVNPHDTMYSTMVAQRHRGPQPNDRNANRRGRRLSRTARHESELEEFQKKDVQVYSNAVLPPGIPQTDFERTSLSSNITISQQQQFDNETDVADDDDGDDEDEEEDQADNNGGGKRRKKNGSRGRFNRKNKRKSKKWEKKFAGPYPVVAPGTRESAFVHAISSAGVAHALTRACSSGELDNCGCDRSLKGMSPEGFQWSGCSDNVDYGITFSRTFVDARDRRKSRRNPKKAQPLMNLHNNEAGRKLLERNMKVECKCHGVSGSCELKTCWRSVAPFRQIGEILKEKFDSAHEVQTKKRRGRRMLTPRFQRFKPHTDTDLVYLKPSSDYCDYNVKLGSLGTHGRECDPRSPGIDGCELMCCNRGYTTRREMRVERCRCKFHWCCFVECEECQNNVEVSTCK